MSLEPLAAVARDFDAIARHYDGLATDANRGRSFPPAPVDRALDIGCGTGSSLEELLKVARHVTGIDISENMLARARSRLERYPGRGAVLYGQVEKLPFPDASFDLVNCCMVLHHASDLSAAIRMIQRVVRPGGTVVVRDIVKDGVTGVLPIAGAIGGTVAQAVYDAGRGNLHGAWRHLRSGFSVPWLRHQLRERFYTERELSGELQRIFATCDIKFHWTEWGFTRVMSATCKK